MPSISAGSGLECLRSFKSWPRTTPGPELKGVGSLCFESLAYDALSMPVKRHVENADILIC